MQAIRAALAGGRLLERQFRVIRPDGSLRWIETRAIVVRDQDNLPIEMHGLHFDITARKTAELKVQESERHFRELAEALPPSHLYI